MSLKTIDVDLIRKFNVPEPRYTSYPPATHFTEETSKDLLIEKIIANNETAGHELGRIGGGLSSGRKVTRLHFGAGTPTFLLSEEIQRLGGILQSKCQFDPGAEASGGIDPSSLTEESLTRRQSMVCPRCDLGAGNADKSERSGIDSKDRSTAEIAPFHGLEEGGGLQCYDDCIEATEPGQLFLHNAAMLFDESLAAGSQKEYLKMI